MQPCEMRVHRRDHSSNDAVILVMLFHLPSEMPVDDAKERMRRAFSAQLRTFERLSPLSEDCQYEMTVDQGMLGHQPRLQMIFGKITAKSDRKIGSL